MSKTINIPVGGVMVEMLVDGDAICRMTNNNKPWEPETRSLWGGLVRPGDTVIDVGAYTGIYSIASAMIGAKVIALEPHPANFARMRQNAALNSVRIDMIEAAASDKTGGGNLRMKKAVTHISDTATMEQYELGTDVMVNTIKLDDLRLNGLVCLIKIDVEHYEQSVLRGALRIIMTHRPVLVVEVLNERDHAGVSCLLAGIGYKSKIILDKRNRLFGYEA